MKKIIYIGTLIVLFIVVIILTCILFKNNQTENLLTLKNFTFNGKNVKIEKDKYYYIVSTDKAEFKYNGGSCSMPYSFDYAKNGNLSVEGSIYLLEGETSGKIEVYLTLGKKERIYEFVIDSKKPIFYDKECRRSID